jgi:hypothetical protein
LASTIKANAGAFFFGCHKGSRRKSKISTLIKTIELFFSSILEGRGKFEVVSIERFFMLIARFF